MQREPEIVKILREEERLKTLQTKSCTSNETVQKSEDDTIHETDDSTLLYTSPPRSSESFAPDQIQTIYRTAFERCPFAILVLDTQQRIISWNIYTESFLRKTNEELYLQSINSLHSPEEWLKIKQKLDNQTGLENQIETKILLKNNETVDATVLSCILKNNDGKHLGYLYIIKNISEQKQSEYRLDTLIQYAEDSIYLLDSNCQYLMVNNQLLSQLGRSREEVLGKTFSDFHSFEETKDFTQKLAWVLDNGIALKDVYGNEGRWYVRTLNPVKDSSTSQTTAVLVISTDITEN
ncbi:MAG: PAS domain-containing protein, partial [Euryarchaeota archaeon]|nr:PAS domain-containing protein [Euryarchaeota archaeon]